MRKSGGVLLLFFFIFLALGIFGAADGTTMGLPLDESGQVDHLIQEFWKVYLLGSILFPAILWFSNYHYTKAEVMSFKSDLLAVVSGISFIFGVWFWAGLLGYVGIWLGVAAGVVAIIVNIVIVAASEAKASNDQSVDGLNNRY